MSGLKQVGFVTMDRYYDYEDLEMVNRVTGETTLKLSRLTRAAGVFGKCVLHYNPDQNYYEVYK